MKTAVQKHERRRAPRQKTRVSLGIGMGREVAACHSEDLSTSGVSCLFPHELSLFTLYDVALSIPKAEGGPLKTTGVVVRSEPVNVDGEILYRIALFFSRITEEQKARLQAYLNGHRS